MSASSPLSAISGLSSISQLDGHSNMRLDLELLFAAERGSAGWRAYGWDGPWVSLGRFQRPEEALIPDCSVPWVVRPTGGRGVLHGHDLTIAIAAPLNALCPDAGSRRSVRIAYRAVVQPILRALRECDLPAALGENTRFASRGGHGSDCFAHVSANDVVDSQTGQKLCGCALRLTESAVLLQASVPVRPPVIDPQHVFPDGVCSGDHDVNVRRMLRALEQGLCLFAGRNH